MLCQQRRPRRSLRLMLCQQRRPPMCSVYPRSQRRSVRSGPLGSSEGGRTGSFSATRSGSTVSLRRRFQRMPVAWYAAALSL
jgi:hypothetical protein